MVLPSFAPFYNIFIIQFNELQYKNFLNCRVKSQNVISMIDDLGMDSTRAKLE